MDLTPDSVDVQSTIYNKEFDEHLENIYKQPKEYLDLERLVEKNGKVNVLTKPGWRLFNPFDLGRSSFKKNRKIAT